MRNAASNQCIFCCGATAEDSLEHYRFCGTLRHAYWRHLRIQRRDIPDMMGKWLLGHPGGQNEERLRLALGVYAAYRSYSVLKHAAYPTTWTIEQILDLFGQMVREGVAGHAEAEHALEQTWVRRTREEKGETERMQLATRIQEGAKRRRGNPPDEAAVVG